MTLCREDSRLHACIVCASISCPNVKTRAYQTDSLSSQMDDSVKDFLANPQKGAVIIILEIDSFLSIQRRHLYYTGHSLDQSANILHLSQIFLWFVGDFEQYGGVVKFIEPYLPGNEVEYITSHNPSLAYFEYNWDLNGVPPCHCT